MLHEITLYLGFEATRGLALGEHEVQTPLGQFAGHKLSERLAIIPILRAGLGMSEGMLELLPNAAVHHIGMYRNKISLQPIEYYNRLPRDRPSDVAFVLDPMIATCGTSKAVVSMLKKWGAGRIVVLSLVASRPGIERLAAAHPDVDIYLAAVDDVLSETGMIIPGLGDAGDRLFGTPDDEPQVPQVPAATAEVKSPGSTKRSRVGSEDSKTEEGSSSRRRK